MVHPEITARVPETKASAPCRRASSRLKWFELPYSGKLGTSSQTMNSPTTFSSGRPSFGSRRGNQALCQGGCAHSLRAASLRMGSLPSTAGATDKRLQCPQNKLVGSATFGWPKNCWRRVVCCRQGQVNAKAHRRSPPRLCQQAALAERRAQCTHNPSVNRTRYGRPAWPGMRYAVHFRQPGQAVLP